MPCFFCQDRGQRGADTFKPEDIAEIEARAEKATEGPWENYGNDLVRAPAGRVFKTKSLQVQTTKTPVADFRDYLNKGVFPNTKNNVDFIAHAREDIPALIAALRERDKRIAELEKES